LYEVDQNLARIVDANCNRVREAIRVIEDVLRFYVEDPALSSSLKQERHEVCAACDAMIKEDLDGLKARDVASDPGRDSMTESEALRADWKEILISNFRRAEEGLRVLEEVSKLADPGFSLRFKRSRFRIYDLEKSCLLAVEGEIGRN
jgi:thiamine-phosphate pyrophosphorylase